MGHTSQIDFQSCLDISALTCNDVRVSIFVRVVWMLRILGRVFVETTVGSDLLVLLAEADVLKRKEKKQFLLDAIGSLRRIFSGSLKWSISVLFDPFFFNQQSGLESIIPEG